MQAIDTADIYTDFRGLAQLRAEAKGNSPEAKMKVAQQFEALFLQMMLKSMRDANIHEGLFDNDQSELYQEMFDQQIALSISSSNSIGFAEVIYQQLGGDVALLDNKGKAQNLSLDRMPYMPRSVTGTSYGSISKHEPWEDAHSFVQYLYPTAEKVAKELNTKPGVILSIAALETGWGKHIMKDRYGSSFNLFGIKASNGWQGRKVSSMTMEYENGSMVRKREYFRAYNSAEESMVDFARFLKSNPRYESLLNGSQKPEQFAVQLKKAGYATDPKYGTKVNTILSSNLMQSTLAKLKSSVAVNRSNTGP